MHMVDSPLSGESQHLMGEAMEIDRRNQIALFVGAGLGAALMFMLDPARGSRRRALVRDKTGKIIRHGGRAIQDRTEDIGNRISGVAAELKAKRLPPPADDQLVERIRAELGHAVEHTRGIEVIAESGNVTLRGYVLRDELEDVLDTARHVNGVRKVRSEMQIKDSAEDIPA
jgi:gas vesicle protein